MTTHFIDGTQIKSEKELYNFFNTSDIPYYGRNLDALNDILTGMLDGPPHFIWTSSAASKASMGDRYSAIVDFLKEVELERDDLKFDLE